ncbi:uncharacterized protein [Panulirus ornatus]|uniref:uncharacterized protein n=1 Tax=Panulirus ornatus TaxID=150431 RepID=UPI003A8454E6
MTDPRTLAHTPTTPPLAQLSPPLPAPTTGMDGWLTLDDLQAQEEGEVLRRQHEVEGQPRSIPSHALALITNQGFYSSVHLTPQPPYSTPPPPTTTRVLASSVAVNLSEPPSLPFDSYQSPLASTSTSPSSSSSIPSSSSLTSLKPQTYPFPPSSDPVSSLPSSVSSSSPLTSPSPMFPSSGLSVPSTPQPTSSPPPSNTPTSSLLPYWSLATVSSPYPSSGARQVRARRVAGRPGGSSSPGVVAATGMLALHQMGLAAAGAQPEDPSSPPATMAVMESSKALSSTVFGFETILTGLVYLSFGIFLYQMIQRAMDTRTAGSLTLTSSGRTVWNNAPDPQLPSLLHSLEEVPNVAAEMVLVGVQGSEVWARRPQCLPLYLCRLNLLYHHQPGNNTSAIRRFALAALSSAMSVWAGVNQYDLLLPSSLASWNGAQGLPCHHAHAACRIHLSKSASHPRDYLDTNYQPKTYRKRQIGTNLLKSPSLAAPLT